MPFNSLAHDFGEYCTNCRISIGTRIGGNVANVEAANGYFGGRLAQWF